jgi:dUTP pyrophosphatase
MNIRYTQISQDGGILPYALKTDAGMDLLSSHDIILTPHIPTKIKTGIKIEIPEGYVGLIWDKSSIGALGVKTMGGVIDSGYRGEVIVMLTNLTHDPITFERGKKIAQLIIQPYITATLEQAEELSETARGEKAFGSTGD